jgi:hypothetical protein
VGRPPAHKTRRARIARDGAFHHRNREETGAVSARTSRLPDVPERTATDDPQPDAAHPDGSATSEAAADSGFDAIADELYELPPDEFVPARDDRVAAAKEAGDRGLARALGRLRRPTKAAWLANLLARHRTEQLDGLVALARGLAQAQQELDGGALRALSGQRHRVVAAMARDAGRLAARRGETVNDGLVREVAGILDAALADPAVAEEVRAGRLTKTVRYSGFGPAEGADFGEDMTAWAASAPQRHARRPSGDGAGDAASDGDGDSDSDDVRAPGDAEVGSDDGAGTERARERAERDRVERERAERERREQLAAERAARERELADAEADEAAARSRQESDEAERDRADERHTATRDRVTDLAAALDAARGEEQSALEAFRAAAAAARDSARDASAAAVRTARARARLDQLPTG